MIKGVTAIRFKTPQSVQREIVSFDRHKDFNPGTYQLVAPCVPKPRTDNLNNPKGPKSKKKGVHIVHNTGGVRRLRGN